jgi:hypothetical protein
MDSKEIVDLAKAVPEVVEKVYDDAASKPLKQVGSLAEQVAKTVRLVLFPFQYAAALQDRLEGYLDQAVRQVPEARRSIPLSQFLSLWPKNCGIRRPITQ